MHDSSLAVALVPNFAQQQAFDLRDVERSVSYQEGFLGQGGKGPATLGEIVDKGKFDGKTSGGFQEILKGSIS